MKTDDISAAYADQRVGLTVKLVEGEDDSFPTVLIGGKAAALTMLAELLLSLEAGRNGETFFMSPSGPGNLHFSGDSTHGVYLHRKDGH